MSDIHKTQNAARLTDYFDAVDRRIRTLAGGDLHYDILICGKRLRVHFASPEDMRRSRFSFTGLAAQEEGTPDAELSFWQDESSNYLPGPLPDRSEIFKSRDDTGELYILSGYTVRGIDRVRNRYYLCRCDRRDEPLFGHSHDMLPLLDMWVRDMGWCIFHGAAVGTEGKGVMIAGRSHAGKSTLAIGCMVRGLDLVTDDQIVAEKADGVMYARPIYRILGLNPDSYERLKPAYPVMDTLEPWEEKLFLDITDEDLPERLPIRAIVVPVLARAEEPEIQPCAKGPVIVRIVHSSIEGVRENNDPATVARMSRMLSSLPVYEMRLTTDVFKNADALGRFIREAL